MSVCKILTAIVAAGVGGSLMDWFFGGVLWHEKYMAYPEIWRGYQNKAVENKGILWATVFDFSTAAIFVLLCVLFHLQGMAPFQLAIAIWLLAPLPQLIVQGFFIKLHPLITVAHSMGWLARLLVAATATALLCR